MEDRETARMRKYGESKTTRIMMATVPHITSGLGLRKFQADGFLLTRVYIQSYDCTPKREQFCGIIYNHAIGVVPLTFISYFTIYTTVFMSYVLFCKPFWDPQTCALPLNMVQYGLMMTL